MDDTSAFIRNACEAKYYRRSRVLGSLLGHALRLEGGPSTRAAITDLPIALDLVFEQAADEDETRRLVDLLDDMVEGALDLESASLSNERELVRATASLLCHIRDRGAQLPDTARYTWMDMWRRHIHLHNCQQRAQCAWRQHGSRIPGSETSTESAVSSYLHAYSHTNSLTLITIAGFPESKLKTMAWLRAQYDLAMLFEPTMRFAQDLVFQPEEPMNLVLHVFSALEGMPVDAARLRLQTDLDERRRLERRLQAHFLTRLHRTAIEGVRIALSCRAHRLEALGLLVVMTALTASLSAYIYAR